MSRIAAPVGPGQPNAVADVRIVQEALVRHERWLGGSRAPQPTGTFDPVTAAAILVFQREVAALQNPDGVVSPRGYTMTALERDSIPPLQHRIFQQSCWAHPGDMLTDADFDSAARQLQCEVAAIRAVADTEAKDSPWDVQGRPVILFERHKFSTHTGGGFNGTHPDLSNPRYGGYGASRLQYERLRRAAMLDETAALKSASWGLFQILGENHVDAGYTDVAGFVTGMMASRAHHLRAFVAFVDANTGMKRAIQQKDWTEFARRYNGPRYADNDYDGKMRRAYERLAPPPPPAPPRGRGAQPAPPPR